MKIKEKRAFIRSMKGWSLCAEKDTVCLGTVGLRVLQGRKGNFEDGRLSSSEQFLAVSGS